MYLFDDYAIITCNYKEGEEKITFEEIEDSELGDYIKNKPEQECSDLFAFGDPTGGLRLCRKALRARTARAPRGPLRSSAITKTEAERFFTFPLPFGDPTGTRTRVTAVKGRCLNRLTMGPRNIETAIAVIADLPVRAKYVRHTGAKKPAKTFWKNEAQNLAAPKFPKIICRAKFFWEKKKPTSARNFLHPLSGSDMVAAVGFEPTTYRV